MELSTFRSTPGAWAARARSFPNNNLLNHFPLVRPNLSLTPSSALSNFLSQLQSRPTSCHYIRQKKNAVRGRGGPAHSTGRVKPNGQSDVQIPTPPKSPPLSMLLSNHRSNGSLSNKVRNPSTAPKSADSQTSTPPAASLTRITIPIVNLSRLPQLFLLPRLPGFTGLRERLS